MDLNQFDGVLETQFNVFDAVVWTVLLLSTLLALFRGFMKEVLSLAAWVGAAVITFYYFTDVAAWLKPYISSDMVATGLATLGTYVVSLMGISIINAILIRYLKTGSEIGAIDKVFGMLFGLARGMFLISVSYLTLSLVIPPENMPDWIKQSKSRPIAEWGAGMVAKLAPSYMAELDTAGKKMQEMGKGLAAQASSASDGATQSMGGATDGLKEGVQGLQMPDINRLKDSFPSQP